MSDEAERILAELLARPGALSRAELRRQALDAMRAAGENPDDEMGKLFLLHQMIVIAAKDDREADELLARAMGMTYEPPSKAAMAALDPAMKEAAYKAIEAYADDVQKRRRNLN